jgi:hypothetical protein
MIGHDNSPLPRTMAHRQPGGYVVRDANGQALVYVYSRENEAEAMQAKRIAINVAQELLGKVDRS